MDQTLELLAPAGSLEKMETAIRYGADAVYIGSEAFSLRSRQAAFSSSQLAGAIDYAHEKQVKVYLALNILARQTDLSPIREMLPLLNQAIPDAVIVSDPGVFRLLREKCPRIPLHISTQASVTNAESCHFWYEQGARRIILARELSLEEIRAIRGQVPADLELEVFVHGAMCVAWSGRCLLSSLFTGRDANRGQCAQPCRWSYRLVETGNTEQAVDLEEDQQGSYLLSSRDLCLIEHLPDLAAAGVSSFKIEGRTKSSFYVATVVKAYREALDAWQHDPAGYRFNPAWLADLDKTVHRPFSSGFLFSDPGQQPQIEKTASYQHVAAVVGLVKACLPERGLALVEQRNRVFAGEMLECIQPQGRHREIRADQLFNLEFEPIDSTPHPQMLYYLAIKDPPAPGSFLRRLGNKDLPLQSGPDAQKQAAAENQQPE